MSKRRKNKMTDAADGAIDPEKKSPADKSRALMFKLVEDTGFEPVTFTMPL